MNSVHAIYENGVFRPIDPVDLPEKTLVVFEPHAVNTSNAPTPAMARVYEVLSRHYDVDRTDLAERHDEHQP